MPKKSKNKPSDRNRVNFSNAKVKLVSSYLALGENRISKSEIFALSNKDIFYQLKNSGYIKKKNDEFCGTAKLHQHFRANEGKLFASSSSAVHSQSVRNSLSFLPQSVLVNGSYKTSSDIEKQFRRIAKTPGFRNKLESLKGELKAELAKADAERNKPCSTEEEHLRRELQYKAQKEAILSRMDWLEQGVLTPDYQITLTQTELNEYLDRLVDFKEMLSEDSKAYEVFSNSIARLKAIPPSDSSVVISVEIATNHYGERELFRHKLFETIEGHPQIIILM